MSNNNSIHYVQAANALQLKPAAEVKHEELKLVILEISKNTFLQFTRFDLFSTAVDLDGYYRSGDYSQFLFDKTDEFISEYNKVVEGEDFKEAHSKLRKVSKIISEQLIFKKDEA